MALYIKGAGGCGYCADCAFDAPCTAAAPVVASYTYAATGGTSMSFSGWGTNSPTSRSVTGTLPPGVTFNGTNAISGTPTVGGTYVVTIGATNACGSGSGTLTITVSCNDCALGTYCYGLVSTGSAGFICIDDVYDVTDYFNCARSVTFGFELVGGPSQVRVLGNGGSILYDSGCVETTTVSVSFTVPSGTTTFEVVVLCGCTSGASGTSLTYAGTC